MLICVLVMSGFALKAQNNVIEFKTRSADNYLSVSAIEELQGADEVTFEFWVCPDNALDASLAPKWMELLSWKEDADAGFVINLNRDLTNVQVIHRNGNGNNWGNFQSAWPQYFPFAAKGQWKQILVVFNDNKSGNARMTVYEPDGQAYNVTNTFPGKMPVVPQNIQLLKNFHGKVDNIRIYNKALSYADLQRVKNVAIDPDDVLYDNLICQYTFEPSTIDGDEILNTGKTGKYYATRVGSADYVEDQGFAIDNSKMKVQDRVATLISPKQEVASFSIFPNPATSQVKIKGVEGGFSYEIYSLTGTVAAQGKSTANTIKIDNLNPGVYFLHIENKGVTKFIKK